MHISKTVLIAVALASALTGSLGGTWMYAQQQGGMLSANDYLEIQNLYYTYSRDVDPGAERDASWMYTPDGVFGAGPNRRVGEEALKEFYEQVRHRQYAGVRHFTSNLVIHPTTGGAKASSYMMIVERREEGGSVEITGFGTYDDTLTKTAGDSKSGCFGRIAGGRPHDRSSVARVGLVVRLGTRIFCSPWRL